MVLEILESLKISSYFTLHNSFLVKTSIPLIRPLRDCESQIEARWNIQLRL